LLIPGFKKILVQRANLVGPMGQPDRGPVLNHTFAEEETNKLPAINNFETMGGILNVDAIKSAATKAKKLHEQ